MMNTIKIFLVLWMMVIGATSSALAASTWRCGGSLVSSGNTQSEVVSRCGHPYSKTFLGYSRRVTNTWYNSFEEVPIEEWVYAVRKNLYYVLKFEGGYLKEVKSHYSQ